MIAMLHGPCLLDLETKTTNFNLEAWTESFNVIYLDQPEGTGFSYVNDSKNPNACPERNEESAIDFIAAVQLFRLAFDDLDSVPLYLAGES
jgi:cathepsin A (carboxypeptidase C)